jgi:hypothetical protein
VSSLPTAGMAVAAATPSCPVLGQRATMDNVKVTSSFIYAERPGVTPFGGIPAGSRRQLRRISGILAA